MPECSDPNCRKCSKRPVCKHGYKCWSCRIDVPRRFGPRGTTKYEIDLEKAEKQAGKRVLPKEDVVIVL